MGKRAGVPASEQKCRPALCARGRGSELQVSHRRPEPPSKLRAFVSHYFCPAEASGFSPRAQGRTGGTRGSGKNPRLSQTGGFWPPRAPLFHSPRTDGLGGPKCSGCRDPFGGHAPSTASRLGVRQDRPPNSYGLVQNGNAGLLVIFYTSFKVATGKPRAKHGALLCAGGP